MADGTVLITGATGFVGRGLSAELRRQGRALTLSTRRPELVPDDRDRVVVTGEIGPDTNWTEALVSASAVVHLAAHVHVAAERAGHEADLFDRINRAGSVRLFEAAAKQEVPLFVFVSSITVLGSETEPGSPFDDASPPRPETAYARSKLEAEEQLRAACADSRTKLVILRTPLICGPGVGGNLGSLIRIARLPIPLPLDGIGNRRTLLARDNLVSAVARVLETPGDAGAAETFTLGDRHALSTGDIVAAMRAGLGREPGLFRVPGAIARIGAHAIGAAGAYRRLFGSLEVDAREFRTRYGWSDVVDTRDALAEAARAWRSDASDPTGRYA